MGEIICPIHGEQAVEICSRSLVESQSKNVDVVKLQDALLFGENGCCYVTIDDIRAAGFKEPSEVRSADDLDLLCRFAVPQCVKCFQAKISFRMNIVASVQIPDDASGGIL
jgi:hypothetical protein